MIWCRFAGVEPSAGGRFPPRQRWAGTPAGLALVALYQIVAAVPETALATALDGVRRVVVAELNLGQYRREVERLAGDREVVGVHRVDGELISPDELLEAIG